MGEYSAARRSGRSKDRVGAHRGGVRPGNVALFFPVLFSLLICVWRVLAVVGVGSDEIKSLGCFFYSLEPIMLSVIVTTLLSFKNRAFFVHAEVMAKLSKRLSCTSRREFILSRSGALTVHHFSCFFKYGLVNLVKEVTLPCTFAMCFFRVGFCYVM